MEKAPPDNVEGLTVARHIDAELIEYERHEKLGLGIDYGINEPSYHEIAYKDKIDAIPTADVEKVVRCKNCKHCIKIDDQELWCHGRGSPAVLTTPEDYCSKGETIGGNNDTERITLSC
ncbi:MAG: hypothetical protein IJS45_11435 [Clostridia bacterium]|nr:hypothetical protein [Clostridia bacterium]